MYTHLFMAAISDNLKRAHPHACSSNNVTITHHALTHTKLADNCGGLPFLPWIIDASILVLIALLCTFIFRKFQTGVRNAKHTPTETISIF